MVSVGAANVGMGVFLGASTPNLGTFNLPVRVTVGAALAGVRLAFAGFRFALFGFDFASTGASIATSIFFLSFSSSAVVD